MFLLLLILMILLMMSCALSSLRALPESMFKFPMVTSAVFSPLLQVFRGLFPILELLDGCVPTCFEAWKEGPVFGLMAVLRPELIVVGCALAYIKIGGMMRNTYREPDLEAAQEQIDLER